MTPPSTNNPETSSEDQQHDEHNFPIVAIGASAGGLEAVTELLRNLSPDTGMAFIYVQHMSPDHKSMLSSLLAKATSMTVQEVEDKVQIEPNHLYVIPPDKEMNVERDHIELTPRPDSPKFNLPIDILFTSLASTHKVNVIGVILSGSASDGTLGLKAIKQEGGLTFAQNETAKFNSMPKSAITAGVVDFILSPKDIAFELNRLSKHPFIQVSPAKMREEDLIKNSDPDLKSILYNLHKITGVDFGAYKMPTIKRRILRRIMLYKLNSIHEYQQLIQDKPEELEILYQDLLINVTSFFRDSEAHRYLKTTLFPKLLKSKKPNEVLRIWVPACSTGEEAFSIAMMIIELQDTICPNVTVQIFATDLSEKSIQKARIGLYSKSDLEAVSPKRIHRFFTKSEGGYRISKAIRDVCVFAPHNILRDPPFSRLDFISCRNLFIYLDTPAQKRVISTFHFALKEPGYLMLGKSETISSSPNLFTEVNLKLKLYARKHLLGSRMLPPISSPSIQSPVPVDKVATSQIPISKSHQMNRGLDSAIDAVLMAEFMPASIVINHQMEIIQFRGSTDLFLTHAPGKATFNLLKMARPEIAFSLRNSVANVIKTNQRVKKGGIEMKMQGAVKVVSFEISPLKISWEEPLILIMFKEEQQTNNFAHMGKSMDENALAKDLRIIKLEEELVEAHIDALAYSQEQEAFIEELQSANEEVVSSNEELQTVNEELETSKEEIESANEELITTNQELQTRNDLLIESYEYSSALIATLHEPMVVLDKDLRVKTASKSFYKKFGINKLETENLLLYDLGNGQWNIPKLRELLDNLIMKNSFFEDFEVTHDFPNIGKRTLMLNASRIVQASHGERLILLSINDVTDAIQQQLEEKEVLVGDIKESRNYSLQLEKAVEERTKQLKKSFQELEEKNIELEKLNKELEAFAYVSSHDLQEPLRKIQTFADRILEKEMEHLSDRGKNYFQMIQKSAQRMQALIQDLLAFSRLGYADKNYKIVDISQTIEDIKIDFKDAIAEKQAVIDVIDTCDVNVIAFQFQQLLHNLMSNSFKFSKPDEVPHITITCKIIKASKKVNPLLTPNKQYCHIAFSDNGIGFEQKYSEKIFEVFEKLHSKDLYPGTGIGLAIVKKIVDNHHGIISAKGMPDKGATFNIYIPTK